ncbi:MAG TPA: hypothetical protein VMW31_02440, partial [Devosiaceae bacterium]|nr:hypothetical protein [Devosiaceae bacterium]
MGVKQGTDRVNQNLILAMFIIAVGLSAAGAGTHFYQLIFKQEAMLRFDGRTYFATLGHLAMSFLCGPYIMLMLGWRREDAGSVSVSSALLSSFIAFG